MKWFKQYILLILLVNNWTFSQEIEHSHSIHHSFIENKGQWGENVLFKSKFDGGNLWVEQNKFMFHLQDYSAMREAHAHPKESALTSSVSAATECKQTLVHLNFLGSNKVTNITKTNPTKTYYNYFLGKNAENWVGDVHGYSEAILPELYTGIDLKLIEQKEELKYEFHVKSQANASQLLLEYVGQKSISIDEKGNLIISTDLGKIIEQKPYSYQIINGKIVEVPCVFLLSNNKVTFQVGTYNHDAELVIDPVLIFATYSGSMTDNFGMTATYAHDGKAYSGGTVYGNAYPTPATAYNTTSNFSTANNATYGITDVFISKYSDDGTSMLWTTFIGGGNDTQGTETVHSLIADLQDNIYLYGATSSTDFPIVNGYQSTHSGGVTGSDFYFNGVYFSPQGTDIYVAKVSSNGQNLLGSTYMGGSGNDGINYKVTSGTYNSVAAYDSLTFNYGDQFRGEIMLDNVGNCLVASCSRSTNFPVSNAFQPSNAGGQDGVIFKLSSDLSTLHWSSYFGGSNNDACYSVKIDSSYNVVFAGGTSSNNLQNTAGKWQASYNGGKTDGFVGKLTPNGLTLSGVSYIGTSNYDQAFFVEIDRNDNVFLVGQAAGGNFPVVNATYVNANSSQFICKLNPSLTTVLNSTTFGNGGSAVNISPSAFLVDICGNMYVSGWGANILQATPLSGMPISTDAFQGSSPNGFDFYLMVLDRTFSSLLYGTYLGGNQANEHVDGGSSRFDKNGVVYQSVCGGCGGYSDFPTSTGAWSNSNLSSNCNNIIFKFDFGIIPNAEFTIGDNLGCTSFEVTFNNTSSASDSYLWDFGNGDTTSVIFNPVLIYDSAGVYDVYLYVTDSICLLTDTAVITITVTDSIQLSVSADVDICSPVPLTFTANSNGTASTFVWSSSINFTDTLNTNVSDSTLTVTPQSDVTYYIMVDNPGGCPQIDSVQVHFTSSDLLLVANDSICLGDTSLVTAQNLNPAIDFNYVWSPDSIIVTPSITNDVLVQPNVTQYVYVTATASNGCVINDSILISVSNINPNVVIASASEYFVPEGDTVLLIGAPNGYSYLWSPSTGVANPTAQQSEALVDQTTIYTLTVSDGICMRSDTVLVTAFTFLCEDPYVFVPNAFSPNGDNENDVLYVRGNMIKEMTFRVFDRWGELMFESHDRAHGWDGTFRGKKMDPDVYDYYLQVTCIDEVETIIKGNITLLK